MALYCAMRRLVPIIRSNALAADPLLCTAALLLLLCIGHLEIGCKLCIVIEPLVFAMQNGLLPRVDSGPGSSALRTLQVLHTREHT